MSDGMHKVPAAFAEVEAAIRSGDLRELTRGINNLISMLLATPRGASGRAIVAGWVVLALTSRYRAKRVPKDLDRAISYGEAVISETRQGSPGIASLLWNTSVALGLRYEVGHDVVDLNRAISGLAQAMEEADKANPYAFRIASALTDALMSRYGLLRESDDLDQAVEVYRLAIGLAREVGEDETQRHRLSEILRIRYADGGTADDLQATIQSCEALLASASATPDTRVSLLLELAHDLHKLYEIDASEPVLDRAIGAQEEAVSLLADDDLNRPAVLADLGMSYMTRFESFGNERDQEEAIALYATALHLAPDDAKITFHLQAQLGAALGHRYGLSGVPEDLDQSLQLLEASVNAVGMDDPSLPGVLSNLGLALCLCFRRDGDLEYLNRGIERLEQVLELVGLEDASRCYHNSNLGVALVERFRAIGVQSDIDQAVVLCQLSVSAVNCEVRRRPIHLVNLGDALTVRFKSAYSNSADIGQALDALRKAADLLPDGHPARPALLLNISMAALERAEANRSRHDLDVAVVFATMAADATPIGNQFFSQTHYDLGAVLMRRLLLQPTGQDAHHAREAFTSAAQCVTSPLLWRVRGARMWARVAANSGDWIEAVRAYETAIELLGRLVPNWLARTDQERLLEEASGIGCEAAAACLNAGNVEKAVELFESGRGVLLRNALGLRPDVALLEDTAPAMANEFERLGRLVERGGSADGLVDALRKTMTDPRAVTELRVRQRQDAARQLDELVADIRRLPGLGEFLSQKAVMDLLPGPDDGQVVLVNVCAYRSDALILFSDRTAVVSLPDLSPDTAREQAELLRVALCTLESDRDDVQAQAQMLDVLNWLWSAVARPVLAEIPAAADESGKPRLARIYWCPSGPLAAMPLHAASPRRAHHAEGQQSVMDLAVSSTISTISALTRARQRLVKSPQGEPGRVLLVAMPQTPGGLDLPGVAAEADYLAKRYPNLVDPLGPDQTTPATCLTVLSALGSHEWVHFACHAYSDLEAPSRSCLLLQDYQDMPMTVAEIAVQRSRSADFAFLSACSTATPSGKLTEESIHLSSALQIAGFTHVIGTLWPLCDDDAVTITRQTYEALGEPGDARGAAHALRMALVELRDAHPDQPSRWASHVHSGP